MSTKYCYSCKETKPTTQFSKNKSKKDGYKDECKCCHGIIRRKTRDNRSKMCVEYKGCKCEDCGKQLTYETNKGDYDFHHVDPSTKTKNINIMLSNKVSESTLKEELDKCVLLCKPCHMKRHTDFNRGLRPTL
jgi:hypothetical protein